MNSYIGIRIEVSNRISKAKNLITEFNDKTKYKIFDFNTNGKITINKQQNDIITVCGKQENKNTGMINFALLQPLNVEYDEIKRIVKIINVLGNGKLLKEKVKTFVIEKSVLNKLPEFCELNEAFHCIESIVPGFIENAWYYAPEIK